MAALDYWKFPEEIFQMLTAINKRSTFITSKVIAIHEKKHWMLILGGSSVQKSTPDSYAGGESFGP